jgi:hypothetical protein
MIGRFAGAKPGCVVASIVTRSLIVGSAPVRLIVWRPVPMLNWMRSGTPGVPFALLIAVRRVPAPVSSLVLVTV